MSRFWYYDDYWGRWQYESSDEDEGGRRQNPPGDPEEEEPDNRVEPIPLNPATDPVTWTTETVSTQPYAMWQSQRDTTGTVPDFFSYYICSTGGGVAPTNPILRIGAETNPIIEYNAPKQGIEAILPFWMPEISASGNVETDTGTVTFQSWRTNTFQITLDITNVPLITTGSQRPLVRVHLEDSNGPEAINVIHNAFLLSPSQNGGNTTQTFTWTFNESFWIGQEAAFGPGLRHLRIQIQKAAPYAAFDVPIISVKRPWNNRLKINFYTPQQCCKNEANLVPPIRFDGNGYIDWVASNDPNTYELWIPAWEDIHLSPSPGLGYQGDNLNMPKLLLHGGVSFVRPDNGITTVYAPGDGAGKGQVLSLGAKDQPILAEFIPDGIFDKFPLVKAFWKVNVKRVGFGDIRGIFSINTYVQT